MFHRQEKYLKAQVDSLKMYTKWAKPYLRTAQKLGMKEFKTKAGLPVPDMVAAFNTMQMELRLIGKLKIDPSSVHESYSKLKGILEALLEELGILEVEFKPANGTDKLWNGQKIALISHRNKRLGQIGFIQKHKKLMLH